MSRSPPPEELVLDHAPRSPWPKACQNCCGHIEPRPVQLRPVRRAEPVDGGAGAAQFAREPMLVTILQTGVTPTTGTTRTKHLLVTGRTRAAAKAQRNRDVQTTAS